MSGEILVATGTDEYAVPYVEALQAVGVPSEVIRVISPGEPVPELCFAKGLLLCGGVDVVPARYGEETGRQATVFTESGPGAIETGVLRYPTHAAAS